MYKRIGGGIEMDELVPIFNQRLQSLAAEFDNDKYFKVNYQPGFTRSDVSLYGQEFLSELDCKSCSSVLQIFLPWQS
jgi:hypothetical protein